MFRDYLALKKNEYLKRLKIEEEIAERFPPITFGERLEFFFRRHLIAPILAVKDIMRKNLE